MDSDLFPLAACILVLYQKLGACPGENRKRREDYIKRIQAPPNTDVTSGRERRPANSITRLNWFASASQRYQ